MKQSIRPQSGRSIRGSKRKRKANRGRSRLIRLLRWCIALGIIIALAVYFRGHLYTLLKYFPRPRVQYLFIHCTATKAGQEMTAEQIRRFHTSPKPYGRGWSRVGYTDMIHLDGRVERLAPNNEDDYVDFDEITYGAKRYNLISRHIVYVGGLDKNGKPADTRTEAQRKALEEYVRQFARQYPRVRIVGHREVAQKACPSFDVTKWLHSIGLGDRAGLEQGQ